MPPFIQPPIGKHIPTRRNSAYDFQHYGFIVSARHHLLTKLIPGIIKFLPSPIGRHSSQIDSPCNLSTSLKLINLFGDCILIFAFFDYFPTFINSMIFLIELTLSSAFLPSFPPGVGGCSMTAETKIAGGELGFFDGINAAT